MDVGKQCKFKIVFGRMVVDFRVFHVLLGGSVKVASRLKCNDGNGGDNNSANLSASIV